MVSATFLGPSIGPSKSLQVLPGPSKSLQALPKDTQEITKMFRTHSKSENLECSITETTHAKTINDSFVIVLRREIRVEK